MRKKFNFIIFIIALIGTITLVGIFVMNKGDELNESGNSHNLHESFYELEEDSIDVLFVGASHAYCSFSPLDLWKKYGFTSYILGSPAQRIWQSYYYLEEAFETQLPKVVVLETVTVTMDGMADQGCNHWAIDPMKWSSYKIESIRTAVDNSFGTEKWLDYMCPAMFYHDRWSELEAEDYTYLTDNVSILSRGYSLNTDHIRAVSLPTEYTEENETGAELSAVSVEYLNRIKELCAMNNAELVLVKAPTRLWSDIEYDQVKGWADKNEVIYIDFNASDTFRYSADINWDIDSSDGGAHLNYSGAVKTSNILGTFLSATYELNDKRDDKKKTSWDTDYKYFKQYVYDGNLIHSYNVDDYLKALDRKNFIICVNTNGYDLSEYEELSNILKQIGCSPKYIRNSVGTLNMSIASNGKSIFESFGTSEVELGEIVYSDDICGIPWYVSNSTDGVNREFCCYIDKENYANNTPGIQFIVYDKLNKKLVDSVIWIPGDDGVWKKAEILRDKN